MPDRAQDIAESASGSIDRPGDVDWFRIESKQDDRVRIGVRLPLDEPYNLDVAIRVYDADLRLLTEVDARGPGGWEHGTVTVGAGATYVELRGVNGTYDARPYRIEISRTHLGMFPKWSSQQAAASARNLAIGDVTGDGRADAIIGSDESSAGAANGTLLVYPQTDAGTLAAAVQYPVASGRVAPFRLGVAVLDADSDGKRDVAVGTYDGVEIFRQTGSGTLESAGVLPGTLRSGRVVAGDVNDDGRDDLVITSRLTNLSGPVKLSLHTQQADGTFAGAVVADHSTPDLDLGDVNGDGRMDIVGFYDDSAHRVVRVYHQTADGWELSERGTCASPDLPDRIKSIEVADVTGDGRADVLAGTEYRYLCVHRQEGSGALAEPVVYSGVPWDMTTGDVDGDTRTDVVGTGWQRNVGVWLQGGDGNLSFAGWSDANTIDSSTSGVAVADLTGDGKAEIATAEYAHHRLIVLHPGKAELTTPGEQLWVRSVHPHAFASGIPLSFAPTVSFKRTVDPTSVTDATVRLRHVASGAVVPSAVSYDSAVKTATLRPDAALIQNTNYRIEVNGLRDTAGATQAQPFRTTFTTVDTPPPAVSGFVARGGYAKVSLSWRSPTVNDFGKVVVRMATGGTPPSSPTSGTLVYAGKGTSKIVTGLSVGRTYSFSAWVRDTSGKYSSRVSRKLLGTKISASAGPTSVSAGDAVKISGRLLRAWAGTGVSGHTVVIYTRPKGASRWYTLATRQTWSNGGFSVTHRTSRSREYLVRFGGSTTYMGANSPIRSVIVR